MKRSNKYLYPFRKGGILLGYVIALPNGANKRQYKVFYRINYANLRNTETAALEWRDIFLRNTRQLFRLYSNARIGQPHTNSLIKKRTTPIIGVTYSVHRKQYGDYYSWVAISNLALPPKRRTFNINTYGYIEAFFLACEFRYVNSGTLIIKDTKLLPCKISKLQHPYIILKK